jgi:hypothetical protein
MEMSQSKRVHVCADVDVGQNKPPALASAGVVSIAWTFGLRGALPCAFSERHAFLANVVEVFPRFRDLRFRKTRAEASKQDLHFVLGKGSAAGNLVRDSGGAYSEHSGNVAVGQLRTHEQGA